MAFDRREIALLLIGDFVLLAVSLWAALLVRNLALPSLSYFTQNIVPFLPMFCIFLATFYISGLYEKQTRPVKSVMGVRILGAQIANVVIAAVLFFLLPLVIAPKTILALFLFISVAALSLWRFYRIEREFALAERVNAFLIGNGAAADELFEEINTNRWYRINFVGRAADFDVSHLPPEVKVVVMNTQYATALARLATAQPSFVTIDFSTLYEEVFDRVPASYAGIDRISSTLQERHTLYEVTKRMFDIVLATVVSVLALPFVTLAALALFFQGGSPFIRHERIGRGGRLFKMIKLRTMLFNDHGDSELQKRNRVTSFGHFLRKTRIDELPQLWNILKGDLSFIGPRPELPKIAEVYERDIPYYTLRHLITPGLSGWAQIHDYDAPRGGADVPRTKKKLSFDLYYLKHRSLGLDLAIAVKTLRALVSLSGV